MSNARTAACLIIGDEILSGKIHDLNSHTLAKALFIKGVKLERIEVISDDEKSLIEAVQRLNEAFDHVFTSGGIGPTHDDVTYASIAKAFGRQLAFHDDTLKQMEAHYEARASAKNQDFKGLSEDAKRMALLPEPAELLFTPGLWVPVVKVENVHILPGVPPLFERMLKAILTSIEGNPLFRELIFTQQSEGKIATVLRKAQEKHPHISIGSYPRYVPQGVDEDDPKRYRVMITFDGPDSANTHALSEQVAAEIEAFRRDAPLPPWQTT
ncbi:MAG: competence/damage-inducible protein A [Deltaproteobacteria bacterium]|nr:competence/damage-inducible protein A [Deltaproteobacteria bacterium]